MCGLKWVASINSPAHRFLHASALRVEVCSSSPRNQAVATMNLCASSGEMKGSIIAGVPVFERSALEPFLLVEIGLTVAELQYIGASFPSAL